MIAKAENSVYSKYESHSNRKKKKKKIFLGFLCNDNYV